MNKATSALAIGFLTLLLSSAQSQAATHSFSLNAVSISGISGEVLLTGGGSYDPSGFVQSGGHFQCIRDITVGPLAGCKSGEGIRWDAEEILTSVPFKCLGSETPTPVFTSETTLVIEADFYRQGDGVNESFKAPMIVSSGDLDPGQPGIQNVWIQGVGCAEAAVNFR